VILCTHSLHLIEKKILSFSFPDFSGTSLVALSFKEAWKETWYLEGWRRPGTWKAPGKKQAARRLPEHPN
jgi:hypothetical protein